MKDGSTLHIITQKTDHVEKLAVLGGATGIVEDKYRGLMSESLGDAREADVCAE